MKLPPLEECRKLIEREDLRIFKVLRLPGLENIRYAFTDEVISLVSPKLPLRQLLYIRKICALSGNTGNCGFEIAHDLNDHEIRKGDSAIRFAYSRSLTRGSMSPLFQEVHAEATRRLTRVNPAYRVRYAGVDLLRTTLVTTEGVRMNAIQYLVYCKWIVEGIPINKLVEELPRRATLAAARSLEQSGAILSDVIDCVPCFMRILRKMELVELEKQFALPDRLEVGAQHIYRVVKNRKRISVTDVRNQVCQMSTWSNNNNFYDVLRYVCEQKRFGIRLDGTILIYE